MLSTSEAISPISHASLPHTDRCLCCAEDRQRGRAAAAYVQALKLQAVVHKATLGKLRKESENAAQRLSVTQQLAVLRDALTSWDADTETNSEVRPTAVIHV